MLSLFGLFSKPKPPPRDTVLAMIPLRNPSVHRVEMASGKQALSAPLRKTIWHRVFGARRKEKIFELDDLGLQVWDLCDGKRNVEAIITAFASHHRINLREAEISVTTFLRMLITRNLMVLATTEDTKPAPKDKRPRKRKK